MDTLIGPAGTVFVGWAIGSTKVCMLVGHLDLEIRLRVIGVGAVPAAALRVGGVVRR